jgi:hypothetical protein
MYKRTFGVLLGALLVLSLGVLGCSATQLLALESSATVTPTRTPRPTWTPVAGSVRIATPTLDATRFPGVVLPTAAQSTPIPFVPGSGQSIFVPQSQAGGPAVQTVVVIIVTATPTPTITPTTGPFVPPVKPTITPTPGPPTATPLPTGTPLPPVYVVTKEEANVRQGPGVAYPVVTRLDAGTQVTVVGRNQAGDWWKVCCVNGGDVWVSDSLVRADGPLWTVAEVLNVPPPPPPPPTVPPTPTIAPTPTFAWPFRVEGVVEEYPLGKDYFRVDAVIHNGAVPLWGYKLRIRNVATGQEWLTDESQSAGWDWTIVQWPDDGLPVIQATLECANPTRKGLRCIKTNLKWDSNRVQAPLGPGPWEVTVVDRAGNPQSSPLRINTTSPTNSKWYYVVFTSKK